MMQRDEAQMKKAAVQPTAAADLRLRRPLQATALLLAVGLAGCASTGQQGAAGVAGQVEAVTTGSTAGTTAGAGAAAADAVGGALGGALPSANLADNLPTAGLKMEHFTTYDPKDPLQAYNRVMFNFNEKADRYVAKPVAQAYKFIVPQAVQLVVSNVFSNLGDVWNSVNNLLQWKPGAAFNDLSRFAINSSLGMFGMADVATAIGLEKHDEDLGQTLGYWGVPSGPYFVLPVFGPSTVRDALARPLDGYGGYYAWVDGASLRNSMYLTEKVSDRAALLDAEKAFDDAALDRYTLLRDGWLARRRNQVYDGDPPEEEDPYGDDPYGDDPYADDPTRDEPGKDEPVRDGDAGDGAATDGKGAAAPAAAPSAGEAVAARQQAARTAADGVAAAGTAGSRAAASFRDAVGTEVSSGQPASTVK